MHRHKGLPLLNFAVHIALPMLIEYYALTEQSNKFGCKNLFQKVFLIIKS